MPLDSSVVQGRNTGKTFQRLFMFRDVPTVMAVLSALAVRSKSGKKYGDCILSCLFASKYELLI